jgi:VWFA-related protein
VKFPPPVRRYYAVFVLLIVLASSPQPSTAQQPTFSTQTNVVLVPTLVKGTDGNIVYGLHANDFAIEDDDVPQAVHMDEEADLQPVSMVIAIQRGRRAGLEFERIHTISAMLEPLLSQGNTQAAIVMFDSHAELIQDFTSDPNIITSDLTRLRNGDSGAAILDAVYFSLRVLNKAPRDRQRVLLVVSETRDHGSKTARIDDVVAGFGNSNTVLYAITFSPTMSNVLDTWRGKNNEWHPNLDLLAPLAVARNAVKKNAPRTIAGMTGGEYAIFKSGRSFEQAINEMTNHLHSRYLLSFQPTNPQPGLHRLRVTLKSDATADVLARNNYWATASSPHPASP